MIHEARQADVDRRRAAAFDRGDRRADDGVDGRRFRGLVAAEAFP